MPATCKDLKDMAYKAGKQIMELAKMGLKASDIVTMKSFENAIMVHAAISGSTNSLPVSYTHLDVYKRQCRYRCNQYGNPR